MSLIIVNIYFLCNITLCLFPISSLGKLLQWLFQTCFFSFGRQKKSGHWSLVTLDRWQCYAVTIAWEFTQADSALVILDKLLSYVGGLLNRFDYSGKIFYQDTAYYRSAFAGLNFNLGGQNLNFFADHLWFALSANQKLA